MCERDGRHSNACKVSLDIFIKDSSFLSSSIRLNSYQRSTGYSYETCEKQLFKLEQNSSEACYNYKVFVFSLQV